MSFKKMREAWKEQVQSLVKFYNFYKMLHDSMKDPYFDDADRKPVLEKMTRFETALKQSREIYEQREKLYETTIKELEEVLAERQRILEDVDEKTKIFELDTDLLDFLSQRQLQLKRKLTEAMAKLDELPNP